MYSKIAISACRRVSQDLRQISSALMVLPEFQQLVLFPVQAAQHWSLLTYQPGIARLCACGSGVGKVFAHSDEHYASFITAIELAVGVDPGALSKNPLRLEVAEQPNGADCGFHVVLTARRTGWRDKTNRF